MKKTSSPDPVNLLRGQECYVSIKAAAQQLGSTREELLHLGAIGKAKILGAVAGGYFEWWVAHELEVFPEMDDIVRDWFDEGDRVILCAHDLAKIEALGGTIPTTIFAPDRVDRISKEKVGQGREGFVPDYEAAYHNTILNARLAERVRIENLSIEEQRNALLEIEAAIEEQGLDPEGLARFVTNMNQEQTHLRSAGLMAPWLFRSTKNDEERTQPTTIDHLFIAVSELDRLKNGGPIRESDQKALQRKSDTRSVHGNVERFAQQREEVLAAALHCLNEESHGKLKATELRAKVESIAPKLWSLSGGVPPLGLSKIEEVIGAALRGSFYLDTPKMKSKRAKSD